MHRLPSAARLLVALAGIWVGWLLLRRHGPAWRHLAAAPRSSPAAPVGLAAAPAPVGLDPAPAPVAGQLDAAPAADHLDAAAPSAAGHLDPAATPAEPAAVSSPAAPPPPADDLRRIRGIGPVLEQTLQHAGIRTYRQLATLDPAGLDRLRAELRLFPGRIEREDWIGQARRLHQDCYGEIV